MSDISEVQRTPKLLGAPKESPRGHSSLPRSNCDTIWFIGDKSHRHFVAFQTTEDEQVLSITTLCAQAVSKRESLHELYSKAKVSNTSIEPALHSGLVEIAASVHSLHRYLER